HILICGFWKEKKHSLYTSMCITAKYSTSQVRVFEKPSYPWKIVERNGKEGLKTINAISICSNKICILNLARQSHRSRDFLCVV
ncbi:hypothetical protein EDC96DRAFT_435984, partial [Choanephora cucurbitarum]